MEGIGVFQEVVKKAMTCLVKGNHLLLAGRNDLALARYAHEALVPCLLEIVHVHAILGLATREKGSFVHEIGKIGAEEPGLLGQCGERSTFSASGSFFAWSRRINSLSLISGMSTTT